MNAKDKLLWLAENYGSEIEYCVKGASLLSKPDTWYKLDEGSSIGAVTRCDIRLTQSEMEKRNPGFEVVEWVGRNHEESSYGSFGGKFVDGWLLRKKVVTVTKSCSGCCKERTCVLAPEKDYRCWIPRELKPVKANDIVFPVQCSCGHQYLERYTINDTKPGEPIAFCWCGFCRTRLNIFAGNIYEQTKSPKLEAPADNPTRVKSWVRWPKRLPSNRRLSVTGLDEGVDGTQPTVRLGELWYAAKRLVAEGCEHTDTPDIETSWTKIGGNQ